MPRDYANSAKPSSKSGQLSGWIWMLGGLIVGLFVAFLVYLNNNAGSNNGLGKILDKTVKEVQEVRREEHKSPDKPAPDKNKPKETPAEKPSPRFDFYYILPELETAIPDHELARNSDKTKSTDANASYILQAASFKSHEDADRLKAKLALLGIEASIQKVTINNDPWHRVRVGPINNLATLNKTRQRLAENGITAIVIKSK